jgi:SAM-dependent methyltransferase
VDLEIGSTHLIIAFKSATLLYQGIAKNRKMVPLPQKFPSTWAGRPNVTGTLLFCSRELTRRCIYINLMVAPLSELRRLIWNPERDYQKTRRAGTGERWVLIQSRIEGCGSLLDIGCSSGLLTSLAAGFGCLAIGVDSNWKVLTKAQKRCRPYLTLTYLHFVVTPQTVDQLPTCDVVLCLSIYHQWHAKFGHEGAQHILRTLGSKARRRMFFEPPSRQSKYGAQPPAITDRDERSIAAYNLEMLGGLFGRENVEFLGGTRANRSESQRYLFTIQMSNEQTAPGALFSKNPEDTATTRIDPAVGGVSLSPQSRPRLSQN